MDFLRNLHFTIKESSGSNGGLSILPSDIVAELQYKIRKGSQDLKQRWSNALELVHKAYEVVGVQRPTPEMAEAWKQYESLIQYAVQRLAKDRGMSDDWRMSAATFNENSKFRVTVDVAEPHTYVVEAENTQQIVEIIKNSLSPDVEMRVTEDDTNLQLKFSAFGICKKQTVVIQKIVD